MSLREIIEKARLAQQKHDKSQPVQLEILPGMFAPPEWASQQEIEAERERENNVEWERWAQS